MSSTPNADKIDLDAYRLFERIMWRGRSQRLLHRVIHTSYQLCILTTHDGSIQYANRYDMGLQTVAINQICGSANRGTDFDIDFYPLQWHSLERWVRVAALMLRDASLPPVHLAQVGDDYYVIDGHHRVSVAHALKQEYIDAFITRYQLESQAQDECCCTCA